MHDEITKFGKWCNGFYRRLVDFETYESCNLRYCPKNVPGTMNSYIFKDALMKRIAAFYNVQNSTYIAMNSEIQRS